MNKYIINTKRKRSVLKRKRSVLKRKTRKGGQGITSQQFLCIEILLNNETFLYQYKKELFYFETTTVGNNDEEIIENINNDNISADILNILNGRNCTKASIILKMLLKTILDIDAEIVYITIGHTILSVQQNGKQIFIDPTINQYFKDEYHFLHPIFIGDLQQITNYLQGKTREYVSIDYSTNIVHPYIKKLPNHDYHISTLNLIEYFKSLCRNHKKIQG